MEIGLFFQGLLIGFSIAAPVGAIGILCINRTLQQGRWIGFVSGLGAATADGLYGCVAGFGLTWVSQFLIDQQVWLRLVGGLFLCYLGWRAARAQPAPATATVARLASWQAYGSTLMLTLTNPATILSFVAIFAGLGLASTGASYGAAALLVSGVFSGSAAWWLLLSVGVGLLGQRWNLARSRWLNYASGAIIGGFGVLALGSLFA